MGNYWRQGHPDRTYSWRAGPVLFDIFPRTASCCQYQFVFRVGADRFCACRAKGNCSVVCPVMGSTSVTAYDGTLSPENETSRSIKGQGGSS